MNEPVKVAYVVPVTSEAMADADDWREFMVALTAAAEEDARLTREIGPWHGPDITPHMRRRDNLIRNLESMGRPAGPLRLDSRIR